MVHYFNWTQEMQETFFLLSLTSENPGPFTWIPDPMPEPLRLEFEAFLHEAGVSGSVWAYWTGLHCIAVTSYYLLKNNFGSIKDLPIETLLHTLALEGGLKFPAPNNFPQPPVLEPWRFKDESLSDYKERTLALVRNYHDSLSQAVPTTKLNLPLERHARWLALNLSGKMPYLKISQQEQALGNDVDEDTVRKACQRVLEKLEMSRPKGRPRKGETNGATR